MVLIIYIIMKKILLFVISSFMLTSCYVHTHTVGNGPQKGIIEKKLQHNFIYGLASGETPSHQIMAQGAEDYKVTTKHTFVNGLVNGITFGIYCPTTVIVER